jgi:hypothetical protein
MPAAFIPHFHFVNPKEKLTPAWCRMVINYHYYNSNNRSLLYGKKVKDIDEYTDGNFDMLPYKRMFKSMRKKLEVAPKNPDGSVSNWASNINTVGIDFEPLALIPIKLNSAVNNIYRVPVEPVCKAQDALAMKKKKEDIEFLKNKPLIEEDLRDLAEQMGIGEVDLGTTRNSSVDFREAPSGIDLSNPEQEDIFSKLFYSLKVETAFEKALKQFYNLRSVDQLRLLLIKDQFKYGVSVARSYESSITGLPELDYVESGTLMSPPSKLPDYGDNTHRFIDVWMTVMEMFNYFGSEICDEEHLNEIINGKGDVKGYCACNKGLESYVDKKMWDTFKVNLKYFEVKSVDWVGVMPKPRSKRGVITLTAEPEDEKKCTDKLWGQNTYGFYWLTNTEYFFGIHRLSYAHRARGREAFQNFSTHIYKSQEKSAVELSIQENKKAQIAEIKLQHTIIKSLPPGKYIDLRFLREALNGLVDDSSKWTLDDLLSLVFEHNYMIGDTQDFDGKNDGQLKPFMEIPGGLKDEARGYINIILNAGYNIASITGINEQLTGQSAEELVGLQQLRINSSLNAIDYCNQAIKNIFEGIYNSWASLIQNAIEDGGATRDAIVDMIGAEDTSLLDALNEAPLHTLTISVDAGNRLLEQQAYETQKNFLKEKGILTTVDEYLLNAIDNPKEKFQKLYFIEERWRREQERIRAEQIAAAQGIEQQRGQNQLAVKQQEGQQRVQEVYAKGDVQAKLMGLGNQLGLSQKQMDGLIKRALQRERNEGQTQKKIRELRERFNLEKQEALT